MTTRGSSLVKTPSFIAEGRSPSVQLCNISEECLHPEFRNVRCILEVPNVTLNGETAPFMLRLLDFVVFFTGCAATVFTENILISF